MVFGFNGSEGVPVRAPTNPCNHFPPLAEDKDAAPPSTKLSCTIGPVSNDVDTLCELLEAGMQVRSRPPERNARGQ